MNSAGRQAVVIGGGVIGTACAHYLTQSGWQVTILDQGRFGQGCSHANCGLVCPSHVLPLAAPGAIGPALRSLLMRNAPFRIKPRLDWRLWTWLYHFARHCNESDMLRAGRAIQALLNSSRSLYETLLRAEGLKCEWEAQGLLFVFLHPERMEHYAETDRLLAGEFNMPARRYHGDEVAVLEPALKSGLAGGWYYPGDAHLRPDRLLSAWRKALGARGVLVRESCTVQGFRAAQGGALAVATSTGEIEADLFVIAAGAWTPLLERALGCRIPIQPGKGYSITMPRPAVCPRIPLIFEEHRVVATPFSSGYRLGSMMEFAGYDSTLARGRLDLLRQGAAPYLREPFCEPVQEEWFGWRPMTYDGLPIIDRAPGFDNVWLAAGHNMLGLSMAPATGKLIAELVVGKEPHLDPTPYLVGRFTAV